MGAASDGALEVDLRLPPEMGGAGGGTNPEELFAVGYAACFEGALGVVARRRQGSRRRRGDRLAGLAPPEAKVAFMLSVGLDVTLPAIEDPATAAELVRAAHQVCPYSNATRGNIEVVLTANGAPVD